uniref:Alpha-glucosidase n=1 Tax=Mesocestoides corti TaxID=53468 RepID=A0A5K3FTC9_MESCO
MPLDRRETEDWLWPAWSHMSASLYVATPDKIAGQSSLTLDVDSATKAYRLFVSMNEG